MKHRHTGALIVTGAALVALIAGGTFATWVASDTADGATITSGALTLHHDGDGPTWFDTSVSGSPVAIDPETFLAGAGDTLRMGQYFTLDAAGTNLGYVLGITWAQDPALTEQVTASYTLTESPGTGAETVIIAGAALGTPVSLPSAGEGDRTFLLDLVLSYDEDRADRQQADVALTDIGELVVTATQNREGVK